MNKEQACSSGPKKLLISQLMQGNLQPSFQAYTLLRSLAQGSDESVGGYCSSCTKAKGGRISLSGSRFRVPVPSSGAGSRLRFVRACRVGRVGGRFRATGDEDSNNHDYEIKKCEKPTCQDGSRN